MSEVTRILSCIESGDPLASEQLLPLVYEELRKLAATKLAREQPGQTLDATALVHEAYLKLVDAETSHNWSSRGHFFGAAAEAMRRILVDNARRKCGLKHGGGWQRLDVPLEEVMQIERPEQLLAIDEALRKLSHDNESIARLVALRYFAGLTLEESAAALEISERTARRQWVYAKAWLIEELGDRAPVGK